MDLSTNHYVYCHLRIDTNEVFYIGKGQKNRAFNKQSRNPYWKNTVSKAGGFKAVLIATGLTNKEALNFERLIITSFKAQHNLKLCNLTDGGDGVYNPSIETRQKQRLAKVGRTLPDETKQKISQSLIGNKRSLGYKHNQDTIKKRQEKTIGTKRSAEACLNISKAKKASSYKHSAETLAKISATKKLKKIQGTV